ncbi:MAG: NifX-associated nitrogen fixation protein [Cyanobacteria bacterium P01_A01_bin.83]
MTTTTTTAETTTNIVEESTFLKELVLQVRAQDSYGVYRTWKDELVIANFVVTKEKKSKISVEGDIDPATQLRILCFYRAIAVCIEKQTGKLCQVVTDLSHEGFGWALVWTGKLVVVSRTLRDAQRFGYPNLKKLAAQGERLVASGIKAVEQFPDAAEG